MKNTKTVKYVLFAFVLALMFSAPIVIELCIDPSAEKQAILRYDLIKGFLTSLLTTVLIGYVTKIISDNLLSVQKNNKKLKEYGIHGIGAGKITYKDEIEMFGDRLLNEHPSELNFLFLTGNTFLANYKKELIKAVSNGCHVRLLIVRPVLNGKPNEYLSRYSEMTESKDFGLAHEIYGETLPIMKEIEASAQKLNPEKCGAIEIRTYIDEFRLNQRYAVFLKKDKREIRCWLNVQSAIKTALSLSLLLRGKASDEDSEENSLMLASYKAFERLWNLYPNSCPIESEYSMFGMTKCGAEFRPKWYEISAWIHMNDDRVVKCPECNRRGFCRRVCKK